MITSLKRLTYFNLILIVIEFAILKSSHADWLMWILLISPLVFNWQVFQKIKLHKLNLQQFELSAWQYIFGAVGICYALLLIFTGSDLILMKNDKHLGLFFGIKDIVFALALIIHFILTIWLKTSLNKIKQINP